MNSITTCFLRTAKTLESNDSRTLYIEGSCIQSLENVMEKGLSSTQTDAHLREIGMKTDEMEEVMRDLQMGMFIKVNTKEVRHMEKVSISGETEKFMTGNGYKGSNKDTECGKEQMENHILDSGKGAKQRAMVCMSGLMGIATKESG